MTSYSGLSDSHEGDEVELAADHRASMLPGGQEPVPGGMNGGSALHEILEFASFPTAAEELIPGAETEATEAVSETLEAYSLDPNRFGAHARWVVRDALSAPLDATACGGPQLAPLRTRDDDATRREVRFVVPIPEAEHRWIGSQPAGPLAVHRGYIEGFIDLIFHDGETIYFADWKSDSLIVGGDYAPETLERHVRSRYAIQANLYTLALTRMLGITDKDEYDRRIGGFFYLFVRGMRSEPQHAGRGIYFDRLSWEGLQQLEARVANRSIALQDAFSTPEHAHAAH